MLEIILLTILFLTAIVVGYIFMIYNNLISLKENIKKSWSNIDVILKQRHDEIPKLISVCESFAEFEKGTRSIFSLNTTRTFTSLTYSPVNYSRTLPKKSTSKMPKNR